MRAVWRAVFRRASGRKVSRVAEGNTPGATALAYEQRAREIKLTARGVR